MDSGNSGSMQSSSGGDEEYDSRSESISAFLNSSSHGSTLMSNPSPPASHQHHPSLFDSWSNYLDPFQRSLPPAPTSNINPLLNLDTSWSRVPPSELNCTDVGRLTGSSSSAPPTIPTHGSTGSPFPNNNNNNNNSPSTVLLSDNGIRSMASTDQPTVRNPKKRSRASRRAPTTVLTTDTTNFRAMVQEFTGIPAPPFSASPFPRGGRLDLFNTALRSGLSDPLTQPYLLRPFAQKLQRPPAFASLPLHSSSSTMGDTVASTTLTNTNTTANANNYQLPSDLSLPRHNQNLLNMQNSILALQSLLQPPPPKYPLPNLPIFGGKSQGPPVNQMMDEFATNRGSIGVQLDTVPNLTASDAMSLRSGWDDGVGLNNGDQGHLKTSNGNLQRVSSCKMNYTASSSDFQTEKGAENASSRGEGMVDSWISSSD